MKIVVRMPNWIGDSILALPAVQSLKKNFPESEIWMASREWAKDLFGTDHLVRGIISLPDIRDLKSLREAGSMLKSRGFDLGFLLTNSFSSALLFSIAGIPERWGYSSDGRRWLLTRSVTPAAIAGTRHQTEYYLQLLSGLGLQVFPQRIALTLSEEEKAEAGRALRAAGRDPAKPLVILNPGAFYGSAKRWPPGRFAEAAALFEARNRAEILIVGSEDEKEIGEAVAAGLEKKPMNFVGKTSLRQLLALLSHGQLFVTNDSGPMHIANALGIPVLALFGPTDPKVTGPLEPPASVLKKDVPCWPCLYRTCPYDHRCMMNIEAAEVFEAGQKYL